MRKLFQIFVFVIIVSPCIADTTTSIMTGNWTDGNKTKKLFNR